MSNLNSLLTTGVIALALSFSGTASAQGVGNVEASDALIKAAKAEDAVMLYTSADESQNKPLLAAFEKKYGIKGDFVRFPTGPLMQRFASEADGKNVQADLLSVSSPIPYEDKPEWFADLTAQELPNLGKWPKQWVAKNHFTWTTEIVSLAYNTDLVPKGTQPTKWTDLTDPKWKGKFLLTDPQVADNYLGWLDAVEKVNGMDFLRKIAVQDYKVTQSGASGAQMVAAGAHLFNAPTFPAFSTVLAAKQAPIAVQYMSGPSVLSPRDYGIVKAAPHPNAARLFLNWLLSDEGTKATCAIAAYSVTSDPEGKLGCVPVRDGMAMDFKVSEARKQELAKAIGVAK
jgi:iron(III) transport system substrate-binding protein